ncbi:hypothetical protein L6452_17301 [Arctium lappa]|uniref:Uncharacterized protein n=1 Tax=Arctium lappa TaxID=4217 RepID=A0ACB9C305_ARCLA|nr:hypothetical protein L6452_17301 [Arctium lappa]
MVKPSIAMLERSNGGNVISIISSSIVFSPLEVTNFARFEGHDLVGDYQNTNLMMDRSVYAVFDQLDGSVALECSRPNVEEIIFMRNGYLVVVRWVISTPFEYWFSCWMKGYAHVPSSFRAICLLFVVHFNRISGAQSPRNLQMRYA